ncbi:cytochrome P450 [Auricularia subglabra TFB-10046 SS5]|nr:cytochrome P450 [Auricularia subglabra TFB-10046 SS5]
MVINISHHWHLGLAGLALFFLVCRWLDFRARVRAVGPDLPGFRLLLATRFPLPWKRWKGVSSSMAWAWDRRFENYRMFGCNIYTTVAAFPSLRSGVHIADPAVVREMTISRTRFPKPVKLYHMVSVFGPNILVSGMEFDEHKKFRKTVAPSFSEVSLASLRWHADSSAAQRNNKLVWDETVSTMQDMFETLEWKDKEVVEFDHAVEVTLPITLFVIGAAGFGRQVSWADNEVVPAGHTMSFKEALTIGTCNLLVKALVLRWATYLYPKWRRVTRGFDELHLYMKEMIYQRRNRTEKGEYVDLFSGMVDVDNDSIDRLTDDEIIGNIFIFLIAGHETTAHTLAFTLGLLALYQDEQDKVYQHIMSVIGKEGEIPVGMPITISHALLKTRAQGYEETNNFHYCLAVMYETLRLFPTVPGVAKYTAEDSVVTTTATRPDGTHYAKEVFIAKNMAIELSVAGMHYNPRYWDSPYEFRPARFMGEYPRDAFMPFSSGVRACIGRRFAETEYIAILVTFLSRYRVTVKDKPEWVALSVEEKRERLMQAEPLLSLTPKQIPLKFMRR